MNEIKSLIHAQNQFLEPECDAILDNFIDELIYAPPPSPFSQPSETQAREKIRSQLKTLALAEDARERNCYGMKIIFEELENSSKRVLCKNELIKAGETLIKKLTQNNDSIKSLYEELGISFETLEEIYLIGNRLFSSKKFLEAVSVYEVLTSLNPSSDTCWFAAGLSHNRLKRWSDAVNCFFMASSLNPSSIISWINLAHSYLQNGDLEGASEIIFLIEGLLKEQPQAQSSYINILKELKSKIS